MLRKPFSFRCLGYIGARADQGSRGEPAARPDIKILATGNRLLITTTL